MQLKITKVLSELQGSNYAKLKTDLYLYITETVGFPEWKQVNYADTYSDLSIKKLTTSITAEEQIELDNIVLVRNWKNDILAEKQRVKDAIYASTNMAGIKTAVDSMQYLTPPFVL